MPQQDRNGLSAEEKNTQTHSPKKKDCVNESSNGQSINKKSIVVTGFEPFGDIAVNPSWEAVKALPNSVKCMPVIKLCLPVVFSSAYDQISDAIKKYNPAVVISVGVNSSSSKINLECKAVNIDHATITDNAGKKPLCSAIYPGSPFSYSSTLPIEQLHEILSAHGISSQVSYNAGTYVCNHVMYQLLHDLNIINQGIIAGFIHVPDIKYISTLEQTRALLLILESLTVQLDSNTQSCKNKSDVNPDQLNT